ncbi:MAG: prepilin peptidase [Lachnospiraceae bacterium]
MIKIQMVTAAVLLGRAVYTDVKNERIENSLILVGCTAGMLTAFCGGGISQVWNGVKMAGILLLALFFLFWIKGLGAGDIKLLCMLAVFFPNQAISILVGSFFAGACLSVGKMLIKHIKKESFYIRTETLHFSIPVAISTFVVMGMEIL